MGYAALLPQRCNGLRLVETASHGIVEYDWATVSRDEPCRVDVSFSRAGAAGWVQEAGRSADRAGTIFLESDTTLRSGDRIVLVPESDDDQQGTFLITGNFDRVPGARGRTHHVEAPVTEVATALGEL